MDVVKRAGELARRCTGPGEVPVEDGGGIDAVESPILVGLGSRPVPVGSVVRIRCAVTGQDTIRMLPVQTQRVGEERSGLGRLAHRRTEDSILAIMATIMPPHA
ncbi:hypothetical protein AB0J72_57245 [Dactylosporangium sp. NPDC049742]|uniref:hypothetical protein n=1 Tax=Dactylosporangium sp. NPDC049742 TaxID=3154737 RepID=UPI003424D354